MVLVVTKLFNIAVSDFDAKKSARYNRGLVVTELVVRSNQVFVVSGTQHKIRTSCVV